MIYIMRFLDAPDYYAIATNPENLKHGRTLIEKAQSQLEAGNKKHEMARDCLLNYLQNDTYMEVVAFLGFLAHQDEEGFALDPSVEAIMTGHSLVKKTAFISCASQILSESGKTDLQEPVRRLIHLMTYEKR